VLLFLKNPPAGRNRFPPIDDGETAEGKEKLDAIELKEKNAKKLVEKRKGIER